MDAEFGEDFAGVEAEVSDNPIAFLRSGVILRLGTKGGCERSDCKCECKKRPRHVLPPRLASPRDAPKRCRSLDHLVGAGEQLRRNFEAKRFSSFAVKDEFEFVYLLDRQLSGLDALKNATHVNAPFVITIP